ncbi:MAG: S-adenosylmethionine:tRNA ribosyltransferase-isomerase [Bacteroidetes bacterium]|nr:MAG: S-adenosylmethionine:tRNA ribosyltransferase-isomerase [Bacteroidota bacterium]TAG87028.1 MAG: S-adenosylmethionine:tRNA ribosyltransferase-isomerase [Bacteroidota bacterium]
MNYNKINLEDFSYQLPEEKIAQFPLDKRDDSKLLVYVKGDIAHSQFFKLHYFLHPDTLLIFNDTKVIPARLFFQKKTGAWIEIFLIEPTQPHWVHQAMQSNEQVEWKCMIGNKKKWKNDEILDRKFTDKEKEITLKVELLDKDSQNIKLSWDDSAYNFADILKLFGELPLPPYLNREVQEKDKEQYQTVYSNDKKEGAVAAPTAGLHFTEDIFAHLEKKGVKKDFITLHVSGGTFQPIKVKKVQDHKMHSEEIIFSKQNIENLLQNPTHIVAVGTTSMRSLESLYWFGVKLHFNLEENEKLTPIPFFIEKLYPYQVKDEYISLEESFRLILKYMKQFQLKQLIGETEIFIMPQYEFRVCKGLVTNFHMPNTTLILLVAAFVGKDWQEIYKEALENNYRFLSYGDSSLLIP